MAEEIAAIEQVIPMQSYLNEEFTKDAFQKILLSNENSIFHVATHGMISSQADETFILAWKERKEDPDKNQCYIFEDELGQWLQNSRSSPIELLFFSATGAATGDPKAILGLERIALFSGARSTIASLWRVGDSARAAIFMDQFYRALINNNGNKAKALQSAQIHLLAEYPRDFDHPYYWGPFVLIENWL